MDVLDSLSTSVALGVATAFLGVATAWLAARANSSALVDTQQHRPVQLSVTSDCSIAGEPSFPSDAAVEQIILNYHGQALNQARAQFWFSIVAASIGFGLIVDVAVTTPIDSVVMLLKVLPGTIMDAVAFLFFKQAAEVRQRATDLYDRLREDKRLFQSIALIGAIQDDRMRSEVQAHLALHIAGMTATSLDFENWSAVKDKVASGSAGR